MDLLQNDLFENLIGKNQQFAEGAILLHGFALQYEAQILADLNAILSVSPLRHMVTPGGHSMSVAMTNCGALGWISDKNGYRYSALEPNSGAPWQPMPESFFSLANTAAAQAGYANFVPDACLINQYKTGTKMGLHQDKDEQDFSQPIVSVSLGCAATFLFGGLKRSDKPAKILLQHGDVIVWGGKTRLNYHGVMPLKANIHAAFGEYRFNLTFRKAA
jgi:alkylated DNA repair protein (DNA oxidative demethylase)